MGKILNLVYELETPESSIDSACLLHDYNMLAYFFCVVTPNF